METLLEAIRWFSMGVSVIPIPYGSKEAAISWKRYQTRLPEPDQLITWFGRNPSNLAVINGVTPGGKQLVFLDFETLTGFFEWWKSYPVITRMVKTARGMHVYFWVNEKVFYKKEDFSQYGPLEIRSDTVNDGARYTLVPPSLHPSGALYETVSDAPILEVATLAQVFPYTSPAIGATVSSSTPRVVATPPAMMRPAPNDDIWTRIETATEPREWTLPDLVAEIRRRKSILDLVRQGVKRGNGSVSVHCPYPGHDDNSMSAWVEPSSKEPGDLLFCWKCTYNTVTQIWTPDDVINVYARMHNCTPGMAIHRLQRELGL